MTTHELAKLLLGHPDEKLQLYSEEHDSYYELSQNEISFSVELIEKIRTPAYRDGLFWIKEKQETKIKLVTRIGTEW